MGILKGKRNALIWKYLYILSKWLYEIHFGCKPLVEIVCISFYDSTWSINLIKLEDETCENDIYVVTILKHGIDYQ